MEVSILSQEEFKKLFDQLVLQSVCKLDDKRVTTTFKSIYVFKEPKGEEKYILFSVTENFTSKEQNFLEVAKINVKSLI